MRSCIYYDDTFTVRGTVSGGNWFYNASDVRVDGVPSVLRSYRNALDLNDGTQWQLFSNELTSDAAYESDSKQQSYIQIDAGISKEIKYFGLGDHNATTETASFIVEGSTDNVTYVTLLDSSTIPSAVNSLNKNYFYPMAGGEYRYYRVTFFDVSQSAIIKSIFLANRWVIPALTGSVVLPVACIYKARTKSSYGKNFTPRQTEIDYYTFNINVKNMTATQAETAAAAIQKLNRPFVFYEDYQQAEESNKAYCFSERALKQFRLDSNHLYSIRVPAMARVW